MSNHFQTVPMSLKEANAYIAENHRHHRPVVRDKFRLGCAQDGRLCGVVMVGNSVARMLCDGKTLEVVRLCTDGTPNACSFLYNKAARIATDLGFSRIITYILESEPGTSLESAGWTCDGIYGGGRGIDRTAKGRITLQPVRKNATQNNYERTKYD